MTLPGLIEKLLRLGPTLLAETVPGCFDGVDDAVRFWQAAWEALRLEERYTPLAGLDLYELAPGVSGELLRPQLESGNDIRMHVNNGAVASFVDTLPLLHPYGRLWCHDIVVTDTHRYRTQFLGPGKYDGSVVNWVNGPLLHRVGHRRGFEVEFAPFRHRQGTNIVTMTAGCETDVDGGAVPPDDGRRLVLGARVVGAAEGRLPPAAVERPPPRRDLRRGDQGGPQGPGAGRHRRGVGRRAAP